jgi:hypothetical protein
MKKWIGILGVFVILLALSNLGTAFAAAWLAKDTTVNESSSGQLLVKDSDTPVTVQSNGNTFTIVLEESRSNLVPAWMQTMPLNFGLASSWMAHLLLSTFKRHFWKMMVLLILAWYLLQAFSYVALTNNGATWNETMLLLFVHSRGILLS